MRKKCAACAAAVLFCLGLLVPTQIYPQADFNDSTSEGKEGDLSSIFDEKVNGEKEGTLATEELDEETRERTEPRGPDEDKERALEELEEAGRNPNESLDDISSVNIFNFVSPENLEKARTRALSLPDRSINEMCAREVELFLNDLGYPTPTLPQAKDCVSPLLDTGYFEIVPNDSAPQIGDVRVFKEGEYGHIDICLDNAAYGGKGWRVSDYDQKGVLANETPDYTLRIIKPPPLPSGRGLLELR